LAVPDPHGTRLTPFVNPNPNLPHRSYQPYATYLANHLDNIRNLNGGKACPIYNNHIGNEDKNWLRTYYQALGRNPSIAQNGINLSRDLRNLP
jgi:hypothetical protein